MIPVRTHAVAGAAYERVEAHRGKPKEYRKAYGALAHKLPGMILQNGLAQATGFLLAKGKSEKSEHRALLEDLNAVLRAAGAVPEVTDDGRALDGRALDGPALHDRVIRSDLAEAMNLTRRSLEASAWIKRYVQGVLRVDATGDQATEDETPAPCGPQGVNEDAAGDQGADGGGGPPGGRS